MNVDLVYSQNSSLSLAKKKKKMAQAQSGSLPFIFFALF